MRENFIGFKSVEVEELLVDSTLNVRALEVYGPNEGYFATSDGRLGIIFEDPDWRPQKNPKTLAAFAELYHFSKDSIPPNFRAISAAGKYIFLLGIGNPAQLYRVGDHEEIDLVYKEEHPNVFYDSIEFWNDQEGIAMGDPTDDCLSVIITRDGGYTWNKLSCDRLPKTADGEAAFAASDTNIAIVGNHTWLFSGGKRSRVFYSPDKGRTWEVFDTPIIQGEPTQGMYSGTFYDEMRGMVVGGDYTIPENNNANKAITVDGGKTWQLVSEGRGIGYKSCVQYVPNSDARGVVTLGFTGISHSADGGHSWKDLSDEGFYTLRFLNDSVAYAAGKGRIAKLTFR